MGSLTSYRHVIETAPSSGGWVAVRRTPEWAGPRPARALGRLRAGTPLVAWGPMKMAAAPRGIGFAVPLRDSRGQLCRGYISHRVVRTLACDYHGGAGEPPGLPERLDVVQGLCQVDPHR